MLGVTKISGAAGDVGLVARDEPVVLPGHVVVAVAAAGICGTDLHIFHNEYRSDPPVTLGHELCGHVIAVGEGVPKDRLGERVVAETFFSTCGRCRHCRNGRPNLCPERRSIGSHVDGAMAARVLVPAVNLHRPPEELSDAAASLSEPVACVTNSLYGTGPQVELGDEVLVTGPGAIGLIAAQVARIMGGHVTLRGTQHDKERLEIAERLGFATSVVGDALEDDRFDVVVECSGAPLAYAEGLRSLAKSGRFVQMGLSGQQAKLETDLICYKELSISAGFASTPHSWERAMALLRSNLLDLESLVSALLPLTDWKEGFDRSFSAKGVKIVLYPND